MVIGGLFVVLSSSWRDRVLRPGPLAQQHAQLLERHDGQPPNCGACHTAASDNIGGWATSLVIANKDQPTQSQLCMNCHAKSIPVATSITPHNLPREILDHITESHATQRAGLTTVSNQTPPGHGHNIACAACHREHHGAQADLTAVDNVACQACHQQRFQSFATDHPDFSAWPYERRTRIIFDHASHQGKHFTEKRKAFDCGTCHTTDASGTIEKTASYEKACATCHDEKIATSVGRGVPMFTLPILDVDALKRTGHDIGAWPKGATGDFDGRLPPEMKLLLSGDATAANAITKLGAGFDFQDLDSSNADQMTALAELAKAIKTLTDDLSRRGPTAVRERLSTALGRDVTDTETANLTAGMPSDTQRAPSSWLGLNSAANTQTGSGAIVTTLANQTLSFGQAGTWSHDDASFAIRYRPAVHADPVLASWLELLTNTPHLESKPVASAMLKELSKATAPGLCASCHSVERSESGKVTINWHANDRSAERRGFTKFSHGSHLVLPQLEHCTSCHMVNSTASTGASYANLNPQQFVSDFKPLTKQQCAECHTQAAAGDACQSCHNYHVEAVEAWRLSSPSIQPQREASLPFRISDFGMRIGDAASLFHDHNAQSDTP
jgi:hypothetical protein